MSTDADTGAAPPVEPEERLPLYRRLAFLVTPKWIALIIGVIAFAMACYLILAPWQFGRNSERSAQNAAIEAAQNAAPAPISALLSTTTEPDPANAWHRVSVTGTFLPQTEAYARLRQDSDDNPVSEVLVSLRTTDGGVVLIDRGYVPASSVAAGDPLPALPGGTVTVTGRVQQDETDPRHRAPIPAPDGREQFSAINAVQVTGDASAYRGYLQLTEGSPGVLTAVGMPQRDPGPFLSYALQWLAFGAMAILGIGYFIYRELTEPTTDVYLPDEDETPIDPGPGVHPPASEQSQPVDTEASVVQPDDAQLEVTGRTRRKRWDRTQLYDPE
jgi:cytochrome oxidase assembly protein ShyY1